MLHPRPARGVRPAREKGVRDGLGAEAGARRQGRGRGAHAGQPLDKSVEIFTIDLGEEQGQGVFRMSWGNLALATRFTAKQLRVCRGWTPYLDFTSGGGKMAAFAAARPP